MYSGFIHSITTGLRSRLSSVFCALNTYGISVPENLVELEDVDSILKV